MWPVQLKYYRWMKQRLKINDLKDMTRETFHLFLMYFFLVFLFGTVSLTFLSALWSISLVMSLHLWMKHIHFYSHSLFFALDWFDFVYTKNFTDGKRNLFFSWIHSQVTKALHSVTDALTKYFFSYDFHFDTNFVFVGCCRPKNILGFDCLQLCFVESVAPSFRHPFQTLEINVGEFLVSSTFKAILSHFIAFLHSTLDAKNLFIQFFERTL